MSVGPSLEQYANRRFSLAGGGPLADHNPYCTPVDLLKAQCEKNGLNFLSFAHYDYLALANDDRVRTAAIQAIETMGAGAGASRLVGGERSIHRDLERDLARFIGCDDALALVSGYGTNLALVGHLLTTGDLIVVDEYAHNSILTGTKLSRAETSIFRHNDLAHLASILAKERGNYRRVLVIVEGLYSMDGDVPELPELIALKHAHNFWLMVDEAHSIGVLGNSGRGLCEHFGIDTNDVDLIVGTLSKSFGACGGFVCARRRVIEWLRYTLPGYVYSVGLPPPTAAAAKAALGVIAQEPERVHRLREISHYFVEHARRLGFHIGAAVGAGIVPIIFTEPQVVFLASEALLAAGIYVPPVAQVGVPKDTPRLRFFLSTAHSWADVDRVMSVLSDWRRRHQDRVGAIERDAEMMPRCIDTQIEVVGAFNRLSMDAS
ncbi:MAG: aminotransferase class I/II-fold pyridoxal phosphate-dependent enzyme [Hyphomicrobiaceae bacterium]